MARQDGWAREVAPRRNGLAPSGIRRLRMTGKIRDRRRLHGHGWRAVPLHQKMFSEGFAQASRAEPAVNTFWKMTQLKVVSKVCEE